MSPERAGNMADVEALRGAWLQLVQLVLPVQDFEQFAGAIFNGLVKQYSAPERDYHNLDHLADMLRTVEGLRDLVQNLAAVRFAVWFHDYFYNPQANDNEERSAVIAEYTLGRALRIPNDIVVRTVELIRLTKTHLAATHDTDGHILLDADLAILGADPVRYAVYSAAVRREYYCVPEPEYRAGRVRVLRKFLERPRLYFTEQMFAAREVQARANLKAEIAALG
jgi:predicted metal-dependent HD superfamily phosphohydrolase